MSCLLKDSCSERVDDRLSVSEDQVAYNARSRVIR